MRAAVPVARTAASVSNAADPGLKAMRGAVASVHPGQTTARQVPLGGRTTTTTAVRTPALTPALTPGVPLTQKRLPVSVPITDLTSAPVPVPAAEQTTDPAAVVRPVVPPSAEPKPEPRVAGRHAQPRYSVCANAQACSASGRARRPASSACGLDALPCSARAMMP